MPSRAAGAPTTVSGARNSLLWRQCVPTSTYPAHPSAPRPAHPSSLYNSMSPLLGGKSDRAVDDHATQLAQFAVTEIGSKANLAGLSLVRVSKLSTQVVAGMKYYFELETKDGAGATRRYEAQVWEKPVRFGRRAACRGSGCLLVGTGLRKIAAHACTRACDACSSWRGLYMR
jgi:hypothetical protein